MRKPVIGFTLDHETSPTYSKKPWYAIRENYLTAISALGGVPLPLPHETGLVEDYLAMIDGLVIIGGDFDIPPSLYGDTRTHERIRVKEQRTAFEYAITKRAVEMEMPVLGICGGEQLLAVVLGGTLHLHVPDAYPDSAIQHEQPNPRDEPGHGIAIAEGSLLHRLAGSATADVNSAHHQSVASPGRAIISATAPDGVIEAIELPGHPFCLGVQWHPEYHVTALDDAVWAGFLEASTACAASRDSQDGARYPSPRHRPSQGSK